MSTISLFGGSDDMSDIPVCDNCGYPIRPVGDHFLHLHDGYGRCPREPDGGLRATLNGSEVAPGYVPRQRPSSPSQGSFL